MKQVPAPTGKLSFEEVISVQHPSGYWGADKKPYLTGCFKARNIEDIDVRQKLDQALADSEVSDAQKETLYVTLLAIYVLTEVFASQKDQWTLLVRKAKSYLKSAGVVKPELLLNQFKL